MDKLNKAPYNLPIHEHNVLCHDDIDADLGHMKQGIFQFVIKINDGLIVDYMVLEYGQRTGEPN